MEYDHILGATDFSKLGDLAVQRAAGLALAGAARLTVLHVLPTPEAPSPIFAHYDESEQQERIQEGQRKALELLRERIPAEVLDGDVQVDFRVEVGDPAGEILSCDRRLQPDLIVLATHGRRGWRRWIMGSVAERVVQMASADVLAIRVRDEAFAEDE